MARLLGTAILMALLVGSVACSSRTARNLQHSGEETRQHTAARENTVWAQRYATPHRQTDGRRTRCFEIRNVRMGRRWARTWTEEELVTAATFVPEQ